MPGWPKAGGSRTGPVKGGQGPLWGGRAVPVEEYHPKLAAGPGERRARARPGTSARKRSWRACPALPWLQGRPAARRQPPPKLPAPEMPQPLALALAGTFFSIKSKATRPRAAAHWHIQVLVREPPAPGPLLVISPATVTVL